MVGFGKIADIDGPQLLFESGNPGFACGRLWNSSGDDALDSANRKRKSLEHERLESFDDAGHRWYWYRSRHHFQW
jgi:hypothetical protein